MAVKKHIEARVSPDNILPAVFIIESWYITLRQQRLRIVIYMPLLNPEGNWGPTRVYEVIEWQEFFAQRFFRSSLHSYCFLQL
jgi:hypothetical protein